MSLIKIALTDWEAIFYIVKWLAIGFTLGFLTKLYLNWRKSHHNATSVENTIPWSEK